jgi:hypothetical protein
MRLRSLGVLTVAGLLAWATPGWAQSVIAAPFVRVFSDPDAPGGPRVYVRAPLVRVNVGDPPPPVVVAPLPPPVFVAPPPPPPVIIAPPTPPPPLVVQPAPAPPVPVVRPMTLEEFARTFRPAPGTYQVTLLHPRTGEPLTTTFTLPPGVPRVTVGLRFVEFDYGQTRVSIVFPLVGGIRVRNS